MVIGQDPSQATVGQPGLPSQTATEELIDVRPRIDAMFQVHQLVHGCQPPLYDTTVKTHNQENCSSAVPQNLPSDAEKYALENAV